MSRTARLTDLLRDRTKAIAAVGALAALAGVGSASAASLASGPAHHADTSATTTAAHKTVDLVAKHHATVQHAAASRRPARPYTIVDSVTASDLPANHVDATYADGSFAVPASQVHGKDVLWIDTNASDPKANALDVEPGDATPQQAATWAAQHVKADPSSPAIIYTMRSDWSAAQSAVAGLPQHVQHQVRWWIADPTGVPHMVPGSSATQWYWGQSTDMSTANPNF